MSTSGSKSCSVAGLQCTAILSCIIIIFLSFPCESQSKSTENANTDTVMEYPASVTCGSTIKLKSRKHDIYLRSQEIQFGTGSQQQAVTGYESIEDAHNFWVCMKSLFLLENYSYFNLRLLLFNTFLFSYIEFLALVFDIINYLQTNR